jgi:ribosomal protein S18 acetylase RimI-like enzyme
VSPAEPAVTLRPAREDDHEFLSRVYASTRAEELAPLPWSDEQRQAFLAQQFHAQSVHYAANFADASFDVVLVDGERAGRIIVARREDELKLIDIALLPEHRGRGIGTRLMQPLLDEADDTGVKVTIYVERFNRALRLYERLGFVTVEDAGVYLRMERRPPGGQVKIAS